MDAQERIAGGVFLRAAGSSEAQDTADVLQGTSNGEQKDALFKVLQAERDKKGIQSAPWTAWSVYGHEVVRRLQTTMKIPEVDRLLGLPPDLPA